MNKREEKGSSNAARDEKRESAIHFVYVCTECITWFWRSFWLIQLVAALNSSQQAALAMQVECFLSLFIIMMSVDTCCMRYNMCRFYLPFCPWHTMPMNLKTSMCLYNLPYANTSIARERQRERKSMNYKASAVCHLIVCNDGNSQL